MSRRKKTYRHPDASTPRGTRLRLLDNDVYQPSMGRAHKGAIVYLDNMMRGWVHYRLTMERDAAVSGGWFPYHFEVMPEDWDE